MLVYYLPTTFAQFHLYFHYRPMFYHTSNNAFYRMMGTTPSYNYRNHQKLIYNHANLFDSLV